MSSKFEATVNEARAVAREKARGAQAEFDRFAKESLTRCGREILEDAVYQYVKTNNGAALDAECVRAVGAGYKEPTP